MTAEVRVGLLDSGLPRGPAILRLVLGCGFRLDADQEVTAGMAEPDTLGHASAVADAVLARCPEASFLVAQIFFFGKLVTTAAQAAAGLDWLVGQGAAVVNMSFGLAADRAVLREACARAVARGVILVASTPTHGDPVFPASYAGVIRVTGDARCTAGEFSVLDGSRADFGAHVPTGQGIFGASVGTAQVTGEIARYLAAGGTRSADAVRAHLRSLCRYAGPQRRAQ